MKRWTPWTSGTPTQSENGGPSVFVWRNENTVEVKRQFRRVVNRNRRNDKKNNLYMASWIVQSSKIDIWPEESTERVSRINGHYTSNSNLEFALEYMDDFTIFSRSMEEHLNQLWPVLRPHCRLGESWKVKKFIFQGQYRAFDLWNTAWQICFVDKNDWYALQTTTCYKQDWTWVVSWLLQRELKVWPALCPVGTKWRKVQPICFERLD